MTKRQRAAHYAVIAAMVGASYGIGIERVAFFADESHWIATSYYLEALLGEPVEQVRPDAPRPFWGESKVTLTQPPLARYVVGLGRRAGGFGVADLNGRWDFGLDAHANEIAGNMPGQRLLVCSRWPMAILSVVSGLLLFAIAWRCAGLLAGYIFAVGFAFNPFLLQTLRRAMGEATLTFFVVLAMVATEQGVRAFRSVDLEGRPSRATVRLLAWWLLAGVCCGLAGAAKLNGLLAAGGAALAAWVAAQCVPPMARRRAAPGAVGILLAATFAAFVVSNPFLYPEPLARSLKMARQRAETMAKQQGYFPQARLDRVGQRVEAAARRVLSDHAILRFHRAWIVNGLLVLCGFVVLASRALQSVQQRRPGTELVVLALGGSLVVAAVLSPLDWDRYYLFPVLFASLCSATSIAAAVDLVRQRRLGADGRELA